MKRVLLLLVLSLLLQIEAARPANRGNRDDVDEVSMGKLDETIKSMKKKVKRDELSHADRIQLENEYQKLKNDVNKISKTKGENSIEKSEKLHKLGGNLYKQKRYDESLSIAKEIARLNEFNHGNEHILYGEALSNMGSVYYRLGDSARCATHMLRAFTITNNAHGKDSKEALIMRGKLLTFKVPDGETTEGISQEEFLARLKLHDQEL